MTHQMQIYLPLVIAIEHKSLIKELVTLGAKVNDQHAMEGSLQLAIRYRLPLDDMEELIKAGAVLSSGNPFISPMRGAIEYNDPVRAKFILDHNIPIIDADFKYALEKGALDIAYEMIIHIKDDRKLRDYRNKLLVATAQAGDIVVTKLLLEEGANVNAYDKISVLKAAIQSNSAALVALLLNSGARIVKDDLVYAIQDKASADVIEQLLKYGADVNERDQNIKTSLMSAAFYGRLDLVELLIQHGAEIDVQSGDGETALMFACKHNPYPLSNLDTTLRQFQIAINFINDHGADVNLVDNAHKNALFYLKGPSNKSYKDCSVYQELLQLLESKTLTK